MQQCREGEWGGKKGFRRHANCIVLLLSHALPASP
jgi:hypothetical protein